MKESSALWGPMPMGNPGSTTGVHPPPPRSANANQLSMSHAPPPMQNPGSATYTYFYLYLNQLIPMQSKGYHLALTLKKYCLSTKQSTV